MLCKINKYLVLQVAGMCAREVERRSPVCLPSTKETEGERVLLTCLGPLRSSVFLNHHSALMVNTGCHMDSIWHFLLGYSAFSSCDKAP